MTLVVLTGATLPKLMQRAGHSTPRAALHYQHAAEGAQVRATLLLDKLVGRASSALSEDGARLT